MSTAINENSYTKGVAQKMRIKLIYLYLENFKGIDQFRLELEGESATVRGTNGAGKTSLFDAYNWLLFGKDSAGHSDSAFDVKPYGVESPVVSVSAKLDLGEDGEVVLERRLAEKTVRQRGTDQTSVRNDYSFFIDDVPKTKTQFDKYIAELCPTDYFRMVSDPDYFAGKLKWDERRKILLDLFGNVDERSLLMQGEDYGELREAIGSRTVADFIAVSAAERKKVRTELDELPGRIAEAERAIPEGTISSDSEMFEAGKRLGELDKLIEEKTAELSRLRTEGRGRLEHELSYAGLAIEKARVEYNRERDSLYNTSEMQEARLTIIELENKSANASSEIRALGAKRDTINRELGRLRDEWRSLNALVWRTDSEVCPHCGQALPAERVESMRASFNADKSRRLERNLADGKSKKEELEKVTGEITDLESEYNRLIFEIDRYKAQARSLLESVIAPPAFEETAQYRELKAAQEAAQNAINSFDQSNAAKIALVTAEIDSAKEKAAAVRKRVSEAEMAAKQTARVEELRELSRTLGKRAAQLDRLLDQAARFEQDRLRAIEDSVNTRFTYASFKLFDKQLNGGYSECCEVVVDDAPYTTNLNPGKKINAGLDIIRTLSEAIGCSAPVWIDNAESYVRLMDIGAQVISLIVDAEARSLTII